MNPSLSNPPAAMKLMELTTQIVSAYAHTTKLSPTELVEVITSVSRGLSNLGVEHTAATEKKEVIPAVPIKKSITPDFVICLEDGKKLKMLKRHLMKAYGMTPQDYRDKWSLPKDYPMVAPNYAATRSQLAKKFGLGIKTIEAPEPVSVTSAPRRGRPRKLAA